MATPKALTLLLLLAAPLSAQSVPLPQGYIGFTFCRNGQVEVWQRRNAPDGGLGKVRDEAVLHHELVHAQQYQVRGCERMEALLQVPDSVAALEAEAYCAELRVFARYDLDVRDLWGPLVRFIMQESGVAVQVAHRALAAACPGVGP